MEQLVHLRLKSIYKAFKQSSRNSKLGGGGGSKARDNNNTGSNTNTTSTDDDNDEDDDEDTADGKSSDPQSLLQAAASAASKHSGGRNSASRHHHHHSSTSNSSHHQHSSHHATADSSKRAAAASSANRDQQAKDMVDRYMKEKEKADAAAAALLAELEEEEQAEKSKKNKKKRKKERERAKKEEDTSDPEPQSAKDKPSSDNNQSEEYEEDDDSDGEIDLKRVAPPTAKKKAAEENDEDSKKKKKKKDQGNNSQDEKDDNGQDERNESSDEVAYKTEEAEPKIDPAELQLEEFINDEDIDGIEQILEALKGVPGRAALRKNAKKALKRLKQQQEEQEAKAAAEAEAQRLAEEEAARKKEAERAAHSENHHPRSSGAGTPATQSETNSSSGPVRPPPPPLPPNELYRVVSLSHNKPATVPGGTHAPHRNSRSQTVASTAPLKSEAVLHIDPRVVGWVIGKGGQRIRDLMEESGAKVWIDQEHMKEHDPRIVYVSGNRKCVETATRLLKELLAKSPVLVTPATDGSATAPAEPLSATQAAAERLSGMTPAQPGPSANVGASDSAAAKPLPPHPPKTAAEVVSGNIPSQANVREKPVANAVEDPTKGAASLSTLLFDQLHEKSGNAPFNVPGSGLVEGVQVQAPVSTSRMENYNEHEMTCEACFVPLLIGRRGWTIKHIQDSSGARVDIDQTVTPRKIKISGKNSNVQTAIRMVRDVLSYPHAQLQRAADTGEGMDQGDAHQALGIDLVAATASSLEKLQVGGSAGANQSNTTVGASNQILVPGMHSPAIEATQQTERVHTPPPSSTINIGDAKSTISASSSLSSTPEPSMASSSKGHFSAGLPPHLLPPEFGGTGNFPQQHQGMPNSNLFGQQTGLHQMNLGNITDSHGGGNGGMIPPQHPAAIFPGGMPGSNIPPAPPRYDMQSVMPRGFSQPLQHPHSQGQQNLPHLQQRHLENHQGVQFGQSMQHPSNFSSVNGLCGTGHQNPQYQSRQEQQGMHHSQSLQFSRGMGGQQMHLHHQSAFHQKQTRHNSAPELAMGGVGHNPVQTMGSGGVQQGLQGGFVPPGMWNDRNASTGLAGEIPINAQLRRPAPADSFRQTSLPIHGGVDQDNDLRLKPTVDFGGDEFIGLPGAAFDKGVDAGFRKTEGPQPSLLATSGRDDSIMVDSLFGPTNGGSAEAKSFLPGFQGLSLGDGGIGSDPWAKNISPENWSGGNAQADDFREGPKSSSALFAAIQPTLDAQDVQHPSRSRFGFHESQGRST